MYVVDTDYDVYALVVEHKHKRNSDKRILFVSLYGRTPVLPEASMETFRRVVTEQGMTEDHIGIQKNKDPVS
ncbi:hypothetical protein AALO_G00163860 [Alosa alosa]|uniref:Lipocalin/cytosolic fatty-acid binding domain-containing protein n=1 Tax=Alosa alosa TaxID=278164 RepID=A0AAV6GBG1_9TELE|nr:hypothetical protein AALO_G00163860 [Alosa alosa]